MIPSLLSILVMFFVHETPKFLLMNKKDRDGAIKALKYYQGENVNTELLLNEMLKESVNTQIDMKMTQAFFEVFRRPTLRRATYVGILSLQVSLVIFLLKDHTFKIFRLSYQKSFDCQKKRLSGNFLFGQFGNKHNDVKKLKANIGNADKLILQIV